MSLQTLSSGADDHFDTTNFDIRTRRLTAGGKHLGLRFTDKQNGFEMTYGNIGGAVEVEQFAFRTNVLVSGVDGGETRIQGIVRVAHDLDVEALVMVHIDEEFECGPKAASRPSSKILCAADGDGFTWSGPGTFARARKHEGLHV